MIWIFHALLVSLIFKSSKHAGVCLITISKFEKVQKENQQDYIFILILTPTQIDRLYEWKVMSKVPVEEALKKQKKITRDEFEDRSKQALLQIAENGLNAKLFYENPDFKTYISVVPVSAAGFL